MSWAERAAEFIQAEDERPYFCMVAFNAVHNFCWQLPPDELPAAACRRTTTGSRTAERRTREWYDDVIVPNLPHGREYYLAQLELMDAEIGKLLDLLDATGQADDTLVVYTTDNGGSTCNFADNTPLRGTKYTVWEGGIRVPMLWRWPARLPSAQQTDALVSTLDLVPTLVAAAGDEVESDGLEPAARYSTATRTRPTPPCTGTVASNGLCARVTGS